MATTSPDNLRTPDPGDSYNLVPDLATFAGDVQAALILRDNTVQSGTASQRTAFTSTAPDGFLWQDTDGIKMIWRKDGAVWVPAVWRWSGSNTQMTGFAPPDGFEWFNTTDNNDYVRLSGAWSQVKIPDIVSFVAPYTAAGFGSSPPIYYGATTIAIPSPRATVPIAQVLPIPTDTSGVQWFGSATVSATSIGIRLMRVGANPSSGTAHVTLMYN